MEDRKIPLDYQAVEAQIRRARLERSVVTAKMFADGADALGRGVSRVVGAILGGFSNASNARTVEAEAFMPRRIIR